MSEIAREAGALLMDYFHRRVKIEYKGDADLVTEADRTSEKLILERIRAYWPFHEVIGEEGARVETGGREVAKARRKPRSEFRNEFLLRDLFASLRHRGLCLLVEGRR